MIDINLHQQLSGLETMKLTVTVILVLISMLAYTFTSITFEVRAQSPNIHTDTKSFPQIENSKCGELPGTNMSIIFVPCNENKAKMNNEPVNNIASGLNTSQTISSSQSTSKIISRTHLNSAPEAEQRNASCMFIGFFICR